MKITDDVRYIGVDDLQIDLFESQYRVPMGMAYNSYVILDEKIAVMDSVEKRFADEWLQNLSNAIGNRTPDYLIVQHMEPDHSGSIRRFADAYPNAVIVASPKAFPMMKNFFGDEYANRRMAVADGSTLSLGKHTLTFFAAPMVHWPEVTVTYDETDGILFSADAFGKFGARNADEDWITEARRYYFGIVGKYGAQVQSLLKKTAPLSIKTICPLHGPTLSGDLSAYLNLYRTWSSYEAECDGVLIAYTSVYGNTRAAVERLAEELRRAGCKTVVVTDLARSDMAEAVGNAFRFSKIVLATTTYNADIFPFMKEFIHHLTERGFKNRTIGLMENGTWVPLAAKVMRGMLESCKDLSFAENTVRLQSAMNEENHRQIRALAEELANGTDR